MVRTVEREEKLVHGKDAAQAELRDRDELERRNDQELPAAVEEAVEYGSLQLRGQLLGAVRLILEEENVELSQLHVPALEMQGLIALQEAVRGKSHDLGKYVYASDRRDLLERALAVLQPDLSRADSGTARELHAQLDDLMQRVGELREKLEDLEDAQEELLEAYQKAELEAGTADAGDKPKPKPAPSDPDAPRPATTLTGPERPEAPQPATTLTGPDRPEPPPPKTTLTGPDRPEPPAPKTTLTGPDRPEPPPPKTTLTGPELPPQEAPPSTLGGDADAARAEDGKKKPWWRRPFG
jgi:hypothetical protein